MALPHGVHVFVGDGRRLDRRFQIERHQQRLDAGVGEVFQDLLFGLRRPAAAPVFRQRLDVGSLASDPFPGSRIAVKIDDPHKRYGRTRSSPSFFVTISTSAFFDTFPKVDKGNSGRISRRSGSLNLAISFSDWKRVSSSNASERPGRRITQAQVFSPRSGSDRKSVV